MEYEVLKRSHLKRNTLIAVLIIVLLLGIVIIKNRTNTLSNSSMNKDSITKEINNNLIGAYIQEGEEYKQTNEIPTSGYEFNSEESYCTVNGENINATINFDIETQTLSVVPLTKKGTKCYLYFDEKDICEGLTASECILTYEGGAAAIEEKGTPDFSKTATTDEGMYAAEDDYGTSYYYRGAVNDNWVQFGTNSSGQPLYWRIVRINGDGSIRLIYNGTSTATEGDSTMIETGQAFNTSYNNNVYVGYMYESGQVHGLTTNSSIKTKLDEWYFANLAGEADKLDGNAGFCGDRYPSTITTSSNGSGGSGTATTHYGAYIRLKSGKNPSFKCTDKDNDLYTTPGSSKGNGALKVSSTDERPTPIGLITADEVAFAGGVYGSTNTSYYLYNKAAYWTMSPYNYNNGARVFLVNDDGYFNYRVFNAYGVRPVINIRSDVEITGSGTTTDPFVVVS